VATFQFVVASEILIINSLDEVEPGFEFEKENEELAKLLEKELDLAAQALGFNTSQVNKSDVVTLKTKSHLDSGI